MEMEDICKISKDSSSEVIKEGLECLSKFKPQTISQYIVIKYNKCLLYQWSKQDRKFLSTLRELNGLTNSRLLDDGEACELLFYNIAQFNYQRHDYATAKNGFEKAIKQEYLEGISKENIEFRIEKRLLLCLCDEYIAIGLKNVIERRKSLKNVILSLVGIDVEARLNEEERSFAGKKLVSLAEKPDQSIQNVLDALIPYEQCNQAALVDQNDLDGLYPSVLQFIRNAKRNGWIDYACFNKWLNELVHILAHCLSECWQIEPSSPNEHQGVQPSDFQRMYYYKRLADILMNKLGDKYITCYAILKIENHEFSSAFNCLNDARLRAVKECNEENRKIEEDSFIAEIDFYCWYFAVCADYFESSLFHKEAFKKYCDTMADKDPVAEIYYHVMNMKELLVIGFDKLSKLRCDEQFKERIDAAFEDFKQHRPSYLIHKEIKKEWGFLYQSYYIYQSCFDITKRYSPDEQIIELDMFEIVYKLSTLLLKEERVVEYSGNRWNEIKEPKFFIVTTSYGEFFYKGSIDSLIKACPSMNIQITKIECAMLEILPEKLDFTRFTNISNVLILANDQSIDADIQFAEVIIQSDGTRMINDKHNIYIDLSQLSDENKKKINDIYEEYSGEQRSIDLITNNKTSILMCVLFSAIENHLLRLKKKLVSNVISPVVQDEPFEFQYRDKLQLMRLAEIGYKLGNIPNWSSYFGSCYSHEEAKQFHVQRLNCIQLQNDLQSDYSKIDYLFFFKCDKGKKDCADLIAFPLNKQSVIQDSFVYGDVITIQDSTQSVPDIITAVRKLYNDNKRNVQNIHMQDCDMDCLSSFTNTDIESSNYRSLREYLYSYLGVLLEKRTFLLIHNKNGMNTFYIICSFKNSGRNANNVREPKTEQHVCQTLRKKDYIENAPHRSGHKKTENEVLQKLKKQLKEMKPILPSKKYIFISYRSHEETPQLCIPVFQDFLYLCQKYTDVEWVIDARSFSCDFNENIIAFINDDNCVGSFIYLSEEYLSGDGDDEDTDKCLMELKMLAEKKEKNPDFIVLPIFLYNKKGDPIKDLIGSIKDRNNHGKGTNGSRVREKALNKIMNIQVGLEVNTFYLVWDNNYAHLNKLDNQVNFDNSLKNALNH